MKIRFASLVKLAVALPLCSIIICILLAIILHWEAATSTHCRVDNYLPSISAAVGGLTPERYVWRIGIALHSLIRYLITYTYYTFYQEAVLSFPTPFNLLVKVNSIFNILEISCLLILTYVSSTENYEVHKFGFIGFLLFSLLHMICTCYLFRKLGNIRHNGQNEHSLRMKYFYLICNVACLLLVAYFFWRHNAYCETGMYSLFALFEYLVVVTNILFHGTATIDFQDIIVEIPIRNIASAETKQWNV